jgi:class 3 adenylate cyclase/tetratricopeptide (TPR) repeat protein
MADNPKRVDASQVPLDATLTDLTERLAENVHKAWAHQRLTEGWRHGPIRNDALKEHPNLVPYDQLPETEREYDRRSALETVQMLLAFGYKIEAPRSQPGTLATESTRTNEELERVSSLLSKGARLQELAAIWNARDQDDWGNSEALFRLLGEGVLKIGEPLLAYDVANQGLEHFPSSVRLRQLLGLALARSGASEAASAILMSLYREGHHDEETLGLLARTYKDLAEGAVDSDKRQSHLQRAKEFYAKAYQANNGYWSGVNAATLAVLLNERPYATKLAREVNTLCKEELKRSEVTKADPYWVLATLGEVALILEEWVEAEEWYSQAADAGRKRYGDLHSSWRNARLLMAHLKAYSDRIEACFRLPAVVVFAGHVVDQPERSVPRFPANAEPGIYAAIQKRLTRLNAGFGYSSAACGSDILFCEAMLERDGEIHIVLPYNKDQFIEASVDRAPGWKARFERVMERAADVVVASERRVEGDGILYEYANRVLYGLARSRAEHLETVLKPLAVWDGNPEGGRGGTASAVELWRAAGDEIEIISTATVPEKELPGGGADAQPLEQIAPRADATSEFTPEIRAMLFADAVGFSKLSEAEVPLFVRHFLGLVGKLIREFSPAPLMKNTWGDGLYFVFPDVRSAGRFALELRERVKTTPWSDKGLRDVELRIGLHAGPVYECIDPVTERTNYIGAHVSRAARIEPITPPGYVYASQPFAALAAAEKGLEFRCDYVGQTAMAKKYGTFPTYVVRYRKTGAS